MMYANQYNRNTLAIPFFHLSITSILLFLSLVLSSCSNGGSTSGAYMASGKVTDTKGNPLESVEVIVENSLIYDRTVVGYTKADGSYAIKLPMDNSDVWHVHASMTKTYNGRNYTIELHPDSEADFRGEDGAVRNFNWRLTGTGTSRSGGSTGAVITRKIASHSIEDIPIGRYIVTASYSTITQPATPLRVRLACTSTLSAP